MSDNVAGPAYCGADREPSKLVRSDHSDPRVTVPMIVEIDNTRSHVSEWNVSGFALENPPPGLKVEEVRTAHVVLRVNDVDIGFDIPCQVAMETELGAAEFKFLGAFTEQPLCSIASPKTILRGMLRNSTRSSVPHRSVNSAGKDENSFWLRWCRYWL